MSDFLAPSSFTPQTELPAQSEFDVSAIDRKLRAVNAVEQKWQLPSLPDEVKLDLVSQDTDEQSLTEFLLGIDSELQPQAPLIEPRIESLYGPDRSAMDQFKIIASGIAGELHPTEVDEEAVKKFKYEAIKKGYLDPNQQIDSNWSPELNSLRREMLYDDIDERYSGNRPGAIESSKAIELIGKWTSPSGLLAAATELDLFWDFGAIENEWSSWGDKWRKVGESENPFDFGKNFIDAVTGPIDDIVFPALNLMMLGSGVGAAFNVGRAGVFGARATAAATRGLRTLYLPSALNDIKQASWTAKRLQQIDTLAPVGRALQAWREFTPVAKTKQAVQLGMRTGFISQVQDLFPGYQGGVDLQGIVPGLDQGADALRTFGIRSPLATIPELAFAPYNIFNPGTFFGGTGAATKAAKGFLAAGGTIPGRAAIGATAGAAAGTVFGDDTGDLVEGIGYGALGTAFLPQVARGFDALPTFAQGGVLGAGIGGMTALVSDVDADEGILFGAATGATLLPITSTWSKLPNPGKFVGWATDVAQRLDFRPITDDQRIGISFQRGIRDFLRDDPDALRQWDETMEQTGSFRTTFGRFLGTDDVGADAAVTYVTVASAIDYVALAQAGGRHGDQYHLFRNKLISQLRTFDLDSGVLPEEVARAAAIDRTAGTNYTKRYETILQELRENPERALELARDHNEIADRTLRALSAVDNVPIDPNIRHLEPWAAADAEERIGILESYIPAVMPTFGDWPKFTSMSNELDGMVNAGVLDGAQFLPVETPWNSLRQVKAEVYKVKSTMTQADDAITDTILREPAVARKVAGRTAPLARTQPTGRFTGARLDTPTKQLLERQAYEVQDMREAVEKTISLRDRGVLRQLETALIDNGLELTDMTSDQLKAFVKANALSANDSQIRYLHSFGQRHGVTQSQILDYAESAIDDIVSDGDRWAKMGLDRVVRDDDGSVLRGLKAAKKREKQIRERARYTAAEIDVGYDPTTGTVGGGTLVESVRAARGDAVADELLETLQVMYEDGYKLVHGVEYLMPHDLATATTLFRDHGVRELNAQTFGNFFGRRQPAVARALQERREMAALTKAIADHPELDDISVDDDVLRGTLRDLRSILMEIQDPIAQRGAERKLMNFWEKFRNAQESAFAPIRVEDLTRHRGKVIQGLQARGYDDRTAEVIFSAIRNFRNTEFSDLGLYALEAKARRANFLAGGLKWLGKTGSESVFSPMRAGTVLGAYGGQQIAAGNLTSEDASASEQLGASVLGLAAGAVVGAGAAKGITSGLKAGGRLDRMIYGAEQRPAWMLGDRLVRLRDGMRFSLSPMFDASRYTEGLMLSKTGLPLRAKDGSRLTLPTNLSPTATKKRLGESAFNAARSEFRAASMGAGNADVNILDDAGHWFAQIGILGFNPQEWQIAAFAHLRKEGFGVQEAYEAARATHTYGLKGRSAAELSTNFVFFPFSFQKKMLTHAGKFLNDDLGRSIMLHDALKTYEELDQRYNLEQFWEDHIPAMRQLQRFNTLAYGISPGRFGGINSQLFETTGKTALTLFTPIALNVKGEEDYLEVQRLVTSLMPAINDINWMVEEAKGVPSLISNGQLPRAQIREGYQEWNEYRQQVWDDLEVQGLSWSDLHNKPYMAQQKFAYEAKLAELKRKYPEWNSSRQNSVFNIQALEAERNDMLRAAAYDPENAPAAAFMLAEYENFLASVKDEISYLGVSVDGTDGWLDAPPWVTDALIERAAQMAEADPRFVGVWKKYFERELGPIEARI